MNKDILAQNTGINLDEVRELFSDETLSSFELQSLRGGETGDNIGCTKTCSTDVLCKIKLCFDTKKDSICKVEPVKDSVCNQ